MNRITIDGSHIESREHLFQSLREQIGEDRLIGSNLDALYDVLTAFTEYTELEVFYEDRLTSNLGDYWKKLLWVINDCLDENENLKLIVK